MNKEIIKTTIKIIAFVITLWIFSNSVNAASVTIVPSTSSVDAGETVTLTISSDCTGRIDLSSTNGTLKDSKVFVEGNSVSTSVTVGSSGATTIVATPVDMSMADGSAVTIGATSTTISIKEKVTQEETDNNSNVNNESSVGNSNSSNTGSEDTSNSNNQNNSSSNSGNENQETKKSSNANLRNLGIRPNDFSGFKSGKTEYNVTVPNDVKSVELYAIKDHDKAKLTGTGTKTLQEGVNKLSVTVTAEDGTQKTYTVNVTREAKEEINEQEEEELENENEENAPEENIESTSLEEEVENGLIELEIDGVEINPNFKTDVYEYTAKYIGEATKFDIQVKASDESYNIEIIGNRNLIEGENLITILVSDKEGKNVATYQITVNKSLIDEEALAREEAERQEQKKKNVILGGAIAVLIIIIIIIIIIVKNRRKRKYNYSVPYVGLNEAKNYKDYLNGYNGIDEIYDDNTEIQDYEKEITEVEEKPKHSKGKRFK